jgi:hypothetical protein
VIGISKVSHLHEGWTVIGAKTVHYLHKECAYYSLIGMKVVL